MLTLHPQYINDAEGNKSLVVITAKEFNNILEELEDQEDIKLYDKAKKLDDGTRISMNEAFQIIEAKKAFSK